MGRNEEGRRAEEGAKGHGSMKQKEGAFSLSLSLSPFRLVLVVVLPLAAWVEKGAFPPRVLLRLPLFVRPYAGEARGREGGRPKRIMGPGEKGSREKEKGLEVERGQTREKLTPPSQKTKTNATL